MKPLLFLDRRRLAVVLGVAAATTLVAIAARTDHRDRSGWQVPESTTAATQAAVIILFGLLALGVLVLTAWAIFPERGGGKIEPRRRTRSIIGTILGLVLLATAFAIAGRGGDGDIQPRSGAHAAPPVPRSGSDEIGGTEPNWALGLAGVVLLLGVGAVVALRRRPAPLDLPADAPVVATEDERVDAVAAAEACTDPRQAVLLAFAAADALLSSDPATRRPVSTSAREWASAVRSEPLSTIVGRYEIARFSHHEVDEDDRRAALDALARLQ